jgi:nitrogen regulatory protein PII
MYCRTAKLQQPSPAKSPLAFLEMTRGTVPALSERRNQTVAEGEAVTTSLLAEARMKRIEAVIAPWALDAFKEAAPKLGISEFDLVEVHRSACAAVEGQRRRYRGSEYTADLPRLRLEFVLFDDDVQTTLHHLLKLTHPESIAVFKLDQIVRTIPPTNGHLTQSPRPCHTISEPGAVPTPQNHRSPFKQRR